MIILQVPLSNYLDGSNGKQQGNPVKAAKAILKVIEDKEPPLRLILGKDAFALLEQKRLEETKEIEKWRSLGEDTAYEDSEFVAIGEN